MIGLTPHSDAVGLTLLFEINEVESLQIRKDGNWISVKPVPNAFVVNVGDILEVHPLILLYFSTILLKLQGYEYAFFIQFIRLLIISV